MTKYTRALAVLHAEQQRAPAVTETIREQTEFLADMRETRAQLRKAREAMTAGIKPLVERRERGGSR